MQEMKAQSSTKVLLVKVEHVSGGLLCAVIKCFMTKCVPNKDIVTLQLHRNHVTKWATKMLSTREEKTLLEYY